jgi:uncharacterized protein
MKFNLFDLLLPRETKFYVLLKRQTEALVEGCIAFRNLATTIKKLGSDEIRKEVARIKEIESKGDHIEKEIIEELHGTFITPFDREDIHMMAVNIDRSLDLINSISNKIEIYKIRKLPKNVSQYAELLVEIAEGLDTLVKDLEKRVNLDKQLNHIHSLETNADYLFHISMADLFKKEKDPIELIKIKEVYEYLEEVINAIDYVGKIVRRVMIKNG